MKKLSLLLLVALLALVACGPATTPAPVQPTAAPAVVAPATSAPPTTAPVVAPPTTAPTAVPPAVQPTATTAPAPAGPKVLRLGRST